MSNITLEDLRTLDEYERLVDQKMISRSFMLKQFGLDEICNGIAWQSAVASLPATTEGYVEGDAIWVDDMCASYIVVKSGWVQITGPSHEELIDEGEDTTPQDIVDHIAVSIARAIDDEIVAELASGLDLEAEITGHAPTTFLQGIFMQADIKNGGRSTYLDLPSPKMLTSRPHEDDAICVYKLVSAKPGKRLLSSRS